MLPKIEHVYPPTTIPTPPYHIVWLANFLAYEEIAWAHDGYIVAGAEGNYLNLFRLICKVASLAKQYFSSLLKLNLCYAHYFSYFFLVTKFACWICSLHLLKERKGERKRKRFPLPTMPVVLLVPSWILILIFRHSSIM